LTVAAHPPKWRDMARLDLSDQEWRIRPNSASLDFRPRESD